MADKNLGILDAPHEAMPMAAIGDYEMVLPFQAVGIKPVVLDAAKRLQFGEILEGLAPQPVSEWGGVTVYGLAEEEFSGGEWRPMANPVPGDGNILPLESVKPSDIIGFYSAPEELRIAQSTIDVFSGRGAWNQHNNFPKIYQIAVNVRYPAETILYRLASTIASQTRANMFIHDNVHGLEKAGAIAAVNDMLLLKNSGVLTLFPNWPDYYNAGFTRLRAGTFLVTASYDGTAGEVAGGVSVYSEKGGELTLALPWSSVKVTDERGTPVELTAGTAPNHPDTATATFMTEPGQTYLILKGE